MITIRKAKLRDYSTLMELEIDPSQETFVSGFGDLYKNRAPEQDFYVVNEGKELLGFFVIDKAFDKKFTFAEKNELGLRNLVIGKQYQGKGYGTLAMKRLLVYVYGAYSDSSSICLTVNKKNIHAYRCYEKAGFIDTDTFYFGGDAGPQHIMRKKIS
ncbi:GNAT family N-acetyltransferase [Vibrio algarum]|uniref:GNAT family N-acetyltransferase n=1 Tax=Vibrio algarum TaxID=3020714 RepID=A0ABT4YQE3_9VIBR|nr:GNAT family N-acetyltransferase [Vibrio sp. KJ40-1]MDB1123772.1 GNAT family N-acetyltransferase [Vibrio sp. KJ40-1]